MLVETQIVIGWLTDKAIRFLQEYENILLLPDYGVALLVVEKKETPNGLTAIWKEKYENEGWAVVPITVTDLQTRPNETLLKALKGDEM